ncbi:MAG: hypothetical protein IJ756_00980 [Paludibacteraceae bacterium]|nr:hypothetical protein [Paludibacteraceae bacterium]
MKEKIVIVGGGSFVCNLINYIESMNEFDIVGYTDLHDNGIFYDVPYLGTDDILLELFSKGVHFAAIGIGNHLNDTRLKQKVFAHLKVIGYELPVIKGQYVVVHKGVEIGEGTILRDGAIVQSNCKLGKCVMIGDRAVIAHDTSIGDFSQVVTGGNIGRGIKIGKSVFMGFNTIVTNDLTIVDNCIIGANSLVNKDCLIEGKYIGTPAKLRE